MKENIEKTEPMEEAEQSEKKPKSVRKKLKRIQNIVILIVVVAGLTVIGMKAYEWTRPNRVIETVTAESVLEKVLPVSDLSTCKCVYNGVAKIYDEKQKNERYRVAYEAAVWAGIDMENLQIEVDTENKNIQIELPEIQITEIAVDIASMEYMFIDSKAETEDVSKDAYQACIDDVTAESAENEENFSRAEENAENVIRAILNPLAEESGYTIEIKK